MFWQKIPSLEEIYNEFHKQYWYALNGVYPRKMKNFDHVLNDKAKCEYLLRFQNMLKRNFNMIDWKIYIKANAEILKHKFTLKSLGSLSGTKNYNNYLKYINKCENDEETIYNEIVRSLQFLNVFLKENNLTFETYLLDNINLIPLSLQHLSSGTISLYFYAAFSNKLLYTFFKLYLDDVFLELFEMNKYDFINNILIPKRLELLKYDKLIELSNKLEHRFLINNNK